MRRLVAISALGPLAIAAGCGDEPVPAIARAAQRPAPRSARMIVGSAERGLAVYESNNCSDCHAVEPNAWWGAPTFHGIWGSEITLTTGQSITVDEAYVRESIDDPYAKVREGLASDMASYEGRLSEQDYADFVAFLKTIRD